MRASEKGEDKTVNSIIFLVSHYKALIVRKDQ